MLLVVGCIGWAKLCTKQRRSLMAGLVFIAPWAGLLIGSPIGGMNIHGPSAITIMLIIPSTLLAFVFLIMAALGQMSESETWRVGQLFQPWSGHTCIPIHRQVHHKPASPVVLQEA
jgi:hypothetical protein